MNDSSDFSEEDSFHDMTAQIAVLPVVTMVIMRKRTVAGGGEEGNTRIWQQW